MSCPRLLRLPGDMASALFTPPELGWTSSSRVQLPLSGLPAALPSCWDFGVLGAVLEFSVLWLITRGLISPLCFLMYRNRHRGGLVTVAGLLLPAYIWGFVGTHGVL